MKIMSLKEYYPSPFEVLNALEGEVVLVGSATKKPHQLCKDIDFVVSEKGLSILKEWDFWLIHETSHWKVLIPDDDSFNKSLEFFCGICEIVDEKKFGDRITYEQAIERELIVRSVYGVELFSLPQDTKSTVQLRDIR